MTTPREGDAAPSFALLDQRGETVRLEDYRGRKLLVYFYPEADTPGCTVQSCDLRDHRQDFTGIGLDVVGISPDRPEKQLAFDEKYSSGSRCSPTRIMPSRTRSVPGARSTTAVTRTTGSSGPRSSSTRRDGSSGRGRR